MTENIARIFIAGKVTEAQAKRAVKRDHRRKSRLGPWKMNAMQRRSEVQLVAVYRTAAPGGVGNGIGWAWVIANYVRVLNGQVTPASLREEVEALGLPPIADGIITQVVAEISGKAWGEYKLYSPAVAGELLMLTSAERSACKILKIDAVDEDRVKRRKRLDRELKAERRAARAALQPKRPTVKAIAEELGVHRNTVRAWIKDGKLDPETGELLDCANPVRRSSLTPYSYGVDPRTKNAQSAPQAEQPPNSTSINQPHQAA